MGHFRTHRRFSFPGKVFLLGEYLALTGRAALVATVEPRFELSAVEGAGTRNLFHPKSPAGLLLEHSEPLAGLGFEFRDGYQGRGGFGASTAQFAGVWAAMQPDPMELSDAWKPLWRAYRELTSGEAVPPSGLDLIAQWLGGVHQIETTPELRAERVESSVLNHIVVFSATSQPGRKLPTHEHLPDLKRRGFPEKCQAFLDAASALVRLGVRGVRTENPAELGAAFSSYANLLATEGLESEAASADRAAFRNLPGVLGVKGTGALLHDGLILVMSEPVLRPDGPVFELARERGLEAVAVPLVAPKGVTL